MGHSRCSFKPLKPARRPPRGGVDRNHRAGLDRPRGHVAPLAGAWIETCPPRGGVDRNPEEKRVTPGELVLAASTSRVAPLAGAWIETGNRGFAPLAGAWIETSSLASPPSRGRGSKRTRPPPSRGRGSKPSPDRRPPRGGGIETRSCVATPRGGVDRNLSEGPHNRLCHVDRNTPSRGRGSKRRRRGAGSSLARPSPPSRGRGSKHRRIAGRRRPSRGRGSNTGRSCQGSTTNGSPPSRGAWIETSTGTSSASRKRVAPLTRARADRSATAPTGWSRSS